MSSRNMLSVVLRSCGYLMVLCTLVMAAAPSAPPPLPAVPPSEVVRGHCSPCHSLRLVTAQRLDRTNWEWVVGDMITKYGATWISPGLRKIIVDYLVEHYGPED